MATRSTIPNYLYYNSDLKCVEYYTGSEYTTESITVQQIIGYTPFGTSCTVSAFNGTSVTYSWTGAIPLAPVINSLITVSGFTPAGFNGTFSVMSSSTTSITVANTTNVAASGAGSLTTTIGTLIQTAGTPIAGSLGDVIYWSGSAGSVAYTYTNTPTSISIGIQPATWFKNGTNGWSLSGSGSAVMPQYTLATRTTTPYILFYNSTLFNTEYYTGSYYIPTGNVIISQILKNAPFSQTCLVNTQTGTNVTYQMSTALAVAPQIGSSVIVNGLTPAGYNGLFTVIASTTTLVTVANTTVAVPGGSGIIATPPGPIIQLADVPVVGALGDIFFWSDAIATLVYKYSLCPPVIQVGVGTAAALWRKGAGTWRPDGALTTLVTSLATDTVFPLVYNQRLDTIAAGATLVQFGDVLDNTLVTPPSVPGVDDTYLVPATGATGAWSALANYVVTWSGSNWIALAPVANATVSVTSGINAGAVLVYTAGTINAWSATPTAGLVIPQNAVTSPATVRGSLYEDSTNKIIEADINTAQPTPLSYVQIISILSIPPTASNPSGLYSQIAGQLPTLVTGSATIAYGDLYYWNASTLQAWQKYSYTNAPAVIGVGTGVTLYIAAKFGGGWMSVGASQGGDVPVGVISEFGGQVVPAGSLMCDGSSYLRSTYPQLFSVIGTAFGSVDSTHFNVPDMRGIFARGVDGTAGNDPDKTSRTALKTGGASGNNVGSYQADQLISHSHLLVNLSYYGDTSHYNWAGFAYNNFAQDNAPPANINSSMTGGNETRPKNVYVNYIIKAQTFSGNQTGATITPTASFTPTLTNVGTATSVNFFWQRQGDSIHIFGSFIAGTTVASPLAISLPAGLTLNASLWASSGYMQCGQAAWGGDGTTSARTYQVIAASSDINNVYLTMVASGAAQSLTPTIASTLMSTGQTMQVNFSLPISQWAGTSAGGLLTLMPVQTANFSAIANTTYPINTTSGLVTMTMPAVPTPATQINVIDYSGTFGTNNLTVAFNGSLYNGVSGNATLGVSGASVLFEYIDSIQGWKSIIMSSPPNVMPTTTIATRSTTPYLAFYNTQLQVAEFYNGSTYQPEGIIPVSQLLAYAPFSKSCTVTAATGTNVTYTWTGALALAPTVGSVITVSGLAPAGFNGTFTITASSTTTITVASTAVGAIGSGTIGTPTGTIVQTAGTPLIGALNDIIYWILSGSGAVLAYTYAAAPVELQLGSGATVGWCRKFAGGWLIDGSTPPQAASASDILVPLVYCSTDGKIETRPLLTDLGSVLNNTLATPPSSPATGDAYLVPATGATGAWSALANNYVIWSGSAWVATAPTANAIVAVSSGVNSGAVLVYTNSTWSVVPTNAGAIPQNAVTTVPTNKGSLYEDTTNMVIEADIATATPTPLSYVQVVAILQSAPTGAQVSGLYTQTSGTLPSLTAGSVVIALNDIYYWNATAQTAWRKFAYINAPAIIGVGSGNALFTAAKFAGSWASTGTGQGVDVPIGVITEYGGTTAPMGSLLCDGSSYLQSLYPQLFSVIGTAFGSVDSTHFNVPDLRGVFPRGFDGTAGNDPDKASRTALKTGGNTGNAIGSYQSAQLGTHTHLTGLNEENTAPYSFARYGLADAWQGQYRKYQTAGLGYDTYTSSTGGNETRPKNVYVNYIIKASTNAATNQSGAAITPTALYIPTITGAGTVTNSTFFWQRQADWISINGQFTAGVTTTSNLAISLPSSLTLNTGLWPATGYMLCGTGLWSGDGTITSRSYQVIASATDVNNVYMSFVSAEVGATPQAIGPRMANAIMANGQTMQLSFKLPISQWAGAAAGGLSVLMPVQTANFTALANTTYPINTTSTAITATLPVAPTTATRVKFIDYAAKFGSNNVTVAFNGSLFNGASGATYVLTNANQTITFIYIDAVQGWKVDDQGYTVKQTVVLNNVNAANNYTSGNQAIGYWAFTYTGSGRPIRIECYPQGFTGGFGPYGFWLTRDGSQVCFGANGYSNGNYHNLAMPLIYISNAEIGTHTYQLYTGPTTQCQTTDSCLAIVTEY